MHIVRTSAYVGPNIHALAPLIRLTIDFGDLATASVARDVAEDVLKSLPSLGERKDDGVRFGDRLRDGQVTYPVLLAAMAVEMQRMGDAEEVHFLKIVPRKGTTLDVLFAYESERSGLAAGDLAIDWLLTRLGLPKAPKNFDFKADLDGFVHRAKRRALGPSTLSLIRAAEARDIPWFRLNDQSLIQLGHGRWQKRIEATTTSGTSMIATEIAQNKGLCSRILADLGLPVPRQRVVYTLKEALRAVDRIGFPVVVKPVDGNHGRGVSVNLNSDEEVEVAFHAAAKHSDGIIVESYVKGYDHRLLVVNGELVAAARRMPGHVVGDGKSSVTELVAEVNKDPRRGVGHENVLTRLEMDAQALRLLTEAGMTADSVPAAGQMVFLRSTANLSTGGTAIDVTDVIHPDNREMAIRAIKAVGLDVGGVDFLSMDITKSYRDIGGGICEVNAGPGFRMHVAPSEGKPRDVAGKVMDMLYPPGTPRRVPIAAITGTNGKTTTSRMLAHIMKQSGHYVGLTTTDAVYINGTLTVKGDMTGPTAAGMVLKDPQVDFAVLETARGGILRAGLGYDRCDVGAILNVAADHLGLDGIDTEEDLARVKSTLIKVATDTAVLNADDPNTLRLGGVTSAKQVLWVTMDSRNPFVAAHIKAGGKAAVLESGANGDMITLYDNGQQLPLIWTHLIPATLEGKAKHNVANATFAAAMAYCFGKTLDEIRHGLRTFDTTFYQTPGRMNIFNEHPFKVILDYGHNPHAMKAMVELVENLKPKGRRILSLCAPGDRRDQDIREVAQIMAGHFDIYVCKEDDDRRGRAAGEVPEMQRKALLEAGVAADRIHVIPDEETAVEATLGMAQKDDLVLIFGADITRCWKQIIYFQRKPSEGPAEETPSPLQQVVDFTPPPGFRLEQGKGGVLLVPE